MCHVFSDPIPGRETRRGTERVEDESTTPSEETRELSGFTSGTVTLCWCLGLIHLVSSQCPCAVPFLVHVVIFMRVTTSNEQLILRR